MTDTVVESLPTTVVEAAPAVSTNTEVAAETKPRQMRNLRTSWGKSSAPKVYSTHAAVRG